MKDWEHPYFAASAKINFTRDFHTKFIKEQKGGDTIGNNRFLYHIDTFPNREGFFLGIAPHCVDVFVDGDEAIIHNFSYFNNCSLDGDFPRKEGTRHLMLTALRHIEEKYPDVKVVRLSDLSTINCGRQKFPMCNYLILMHGTTYYIQYGFTLEQNKKDLSRVNKKIKKQIITMETVKDFVENNDFSTEKNAKFLELAEAVLEEPMFLRDFLKEIRFIKDKGKKNCRFFFSFIQFIYYKWFAKYNFLHREYLLKQNML